MLNFKKFPKELQRKVSKIKEAIKDFFEWIKPFYPVEYTHELLGNGNPKYSKLNFCNLKGKRFVSKYKKLWNTLQPQIVMECISRFERLYGKPAYIVSDYVKNSAAIDAYMHDIMCDTTPQKKVTFDIYLNPFNNVLIEEVEMKIDTLGIGYREYRRYSIPLDVFTNQ